MHGTSTRRTGTPTYGRRRQRNGTCGSIPPRGRAAASGPSRASACSTSPVATGSTRGGWSSWAPAHRHGDPTSRSRCSGACSSPQHRGERGHRVPALRRHRRRGAARARPRGVRCGGLQYGPDGRPRDRPAGGVPAVAPGGERPFRLLDHAPLLQPARDAVRGRGRVRGRRPRVPSRCLHVPLPDGGERRGRGDRQPGQPANQLYFDRPLSQLLAPFFAAGLALDGIEEPAFPEGEEADGPGWRTTPELPPFLVARLRR